MSEIKSTGVNLNLGGGFTGLLTIALIVLKLLGVISISWWWVFSPLIIGFIITLLVIVALIAVIWAAK